MHEMTIAQEICRIARERVGVDACHRMVAVGVDIGDDAGIEPDNLLFWLEVLLSEAPFGRASPVLRRGHGNDLRITYVEVEDGGPED